MSDFHNYVFSDLHEQNMSLEEELKKLKELYIVVSTAYVEKIAERNAWKEIAVGLYNGSLYADIRWKGEASSTMEIFRNACEAYTKLLEADSLRESSAYYER
jgi:hypothetical protein